ncbi:MAG: glycosyltransferase family 2 protein [Armatimonadota bacterium]
MPTVAVILLNWNGGNLTISCIKSLIAGSRRPDLIVVVDNASEDKSTDQIAESFPDIRLIHNSVNLGFAGGNNVAIEQAIAEEYDYIWLLNNDTEVAFDCLESLLCYMESTPEVAACCGKILYYGYRKTIWYAGARIDWWNLNSQHIGAMQEDHGQYDNISQVHFLTGCCMFVRQTSFKSVGLFDERFFAYSEDLDWSIRAVKQGLKLAYVPDAVLLHKVSASIKKTRSRTTKGSSSPFAIYLSIRNHFFIIRKHATHLPHFLYAAVNAIAKAIVYAAGLVILGRWDKLKSVLNALYDGLALRVR